MSFMNAAKRAASFIGVGAMICLVGALIFGCSTVSPKIQSSLEEQTGIKIAYEGLVTSESEFWPEDALKQAFTRYWATRYNGTWEEALALEAPHFQEMVPHGRYRFYAKGFSRNELLEVVVRDLIQAGDYLYEFSLGLRFRTGGGEEKMSWFQEQWVKVDGRWYHVLKDRFVFPTV